MYQPLLYKPESHLSHHFFVLCSFVGFFLEFSGPGAAELMTFVCFLANRGYFVCAPILPVGIRLGNFLVV